MLLAEFEKRVVGPLDVDVTEAAPEGHRAAGLFHDPGTEIFVGHEKQIFIFGSGVDDFDGVAAGADDVAESFYFGAAIDVGDGVEIRIGRLERAQAFGRATRFERTPGVLVRKDHGFGGVQDLGGLGHEVDAAEDDDIRFCFCGLLGEAERIADVIGDILDFADLIIVRENDRVQLFLEFDDFDAKACRAARAFFAREWESDPPLRPFLPRHQSWRERIAADIHRQRRPGSPDFNFRSASCAGLDT